MTSVRFSVRFCKKTAVFRFGFSFTKLTAVSVFGSVFLHCVLFNVCNARNDVLPRWIGPTNCQPKWLRPRSADIWREAKYVDCWTYHAARWTVNETTWKTAPNQCRFSENGIVETEFSGFEFWSRFGSVFRKLISKIFIGFRKSLYKILLHVYSVA